MLARLTLLQSQLPPRYHTAAMLADKILDTVRGEWFAASLLSGASHSDPHALAAQAKLLLATGPPGIRSPASLSALPAPAPPPPPPFLPSHRARALARRHLDDRHHHP